jgi:hypothetical protein
MAYDDATGQIVLFGGQSTGPGLQPLGDTWTWDGRNWTARKPVQSPPATVNMSLAYDASRQTVVGVRDNDPATVSETWQWNGTTWGRLQAGRVPKWTKQGAGMAYATSTADMTLFGTTFGIGAPAPDGDTWTFTANTWTDRAPAPSDPNARSFPGMSPDTRGGVLMFGGGGSGFTLFGDTWTYFQHEWSNVSVSPGPQARTMAKMAYDSDCGLVLLYGGEAPTGTTVTRYKDTWAWNGQTWTQVG